MLYETWLVISYSAPHSQSVVRSKQIVIVVTTKNTFPLITRKQSALSSTQQLPSAQSGFVITWKQDWQQCNKKVDSARNDHGFHSTSSAEQQTLDGAFSGWYLNSLPVMVIIVFKYLDACCSSLSCPSFSQRKIKFYMPGFSTDNSLMLKLKPTLVSDGVSIRVHNSFTCEATKGGWTRNN